MGGVDDEDYAKECYALVEELQLKNLIFTGRVDVVQYMQKLDFTILTSISEGQPLSVLESMAARRPCVTTEVGCCRELLEGAPGDTFGIAGYCVPPMYVRGWPMRWRRCVPAVPGAKRWGALAKDGWMLTFTTSRCWRTTAKCTTKQLRNITWSNHGRNWI